MSQVFTRYGKCYTFNAGSDGRPPLITTKGGMGNGLEIMLDIQQDEYLPVWGETGEGIKPTTSSVGEKHTSFTALTFFIVLQMRRPLKLGSKFRSTVRTSLRS